MIMYFNWKNNSSVNLYHTSILSEILLSSLLLTKTKVKKKKISFPLVKKVNMIEALIMESQE